MTRSLSRPRIGAFRRPAESLCRFSFVGMALFGIASSAIASPQTFEPASVSSVYATEQAGASFGAPGPEGPTGALTFVPSLGETFGTSIAGGTHGDGTVYGIVGGTLQIVHSFDSSVPNDGAVPGAGVIYGVDGNLYGTTVFGGAKGQGTIFKMTTGGTVTILHSFGSVAHDGLNPDCKLVQSPNGFLYGTTTYGGTDNSGVAFSIMPNGTNYGIVHHFHNGSVVGDGIHPDAGLTLGPDGNLYGVTTDGGSTVAGDTEDGLGFGTIFKMTTRGAVTILHNFSDGTVQNDGAHPYGALTVGLDGAFYGATAEGGTLPYNSPWRGNGTTFSVKTNGSYQRLYDFVDASPIDGVGPESQLIQQSDGLFYGTTPADTLGLDFGVAYEMTAAGDENVFHVFGGIGDGKTPLTSLVETNYGLVGTTYNGGALDKGSVFQINILPGMPQNVTTTPLYRSVKVDWTAGARDLIFKLWRSDDLVGNNTIYLGQFTKTTFTDTTAVTGKTYYYRLIAENDGTQSAETTPVAGSPLNLLTFVGTDTTSGGNWKNLHGHDGRWIIRYPGLSSAGLVLPSWGGVSGTGSTTLLRAQSTAAYALQYPVSGSTQRCLGEMTSTTSFTMNVNVTDGISHPFSIYAVDWGNAGRSETVVVSNRATGAPLDTRTISNFANGVYLTWTANFPVTLTVTKTAGPDCAVDGVFFGGALGLVVPSTPVVQATAGTGQIALSWPAVNNATSYNVYRSTTSGAEGATPYHTGIATNGYTDTGLATGAKYYYQVMAVNANGGSAASTEVSAVAK